MDSLEEAQRLMETVQKRVEGQEIIGGEAALQMLSLHIALAQAEQTNALAEAARQQNVQLERIANALEQLVRRD